MKKALNWVELAKVFMGTHACIQKRLAIAEADDGWMQRDFIVVCE